MSSRRPTLVGVLLAVAGLALLVWQVRLVGLDHIADGFRAVGWLGFLAILLLSLFRFTARSLAWTTLMARPVPLRSATAATISGDALGNLSFLSLLVSEPAKAFYVTRHAPAAEAFAALTAENFFYSVSVAAVILGGTITLLATFVLPDAFRFVVWLSLAAMGGVLAMAIWLAHKRPALTVWARKALRGRLTRALDKLQSLETQTYSALSTSPARLAIVMACEVAFHAASVTEAWLTLTLLQGSASLFNAFLLDTVNRLINVVFRAVPMRVGVDEVTTSGFAEMLGLGSASGLTLALVRKARMLFWAGIGLALLGRRAIRRIL
ncbi:MAG TPA: lysylphosphatidylglycerol synthase domain-containing protein [Vicinamibacterales bacterium]|nr:lysylphosphatidylglycerol synthase domain-containing protein [Vicinamibacterales bacterium]